MLTIESVLALFVMLAISSFSPFFAQRLRIPHTVFLVGIGIILGIVSLVPQLNFLDTFSLTPELLFYIFLPTLIFESAFNIRIKKLTNDARIIGLLSVVSLAISAFVVGFFLDTILGFFSINIPFILSLLFGAIISATDPVAVLALFKEYGAPTRLSLIFEGESIFNDGTGVALFMVVLAIAESGGYGLLEIGHGTASFVVMVLGGIVFGLVMGGLFATLIGYTRTNEFASITLTMVLAHLTFIFADLISQHAHIGTTAIHISPIIATAIASLVMGNYGRYKLPAHATEFVKQYWSQFAFLANSLIFILIGMLAMQLPRAASEFVAVIVSTVVIVALARAVSIYPVVSLYNRFAASELHVSRAWQHVLAWGSLRGALAVTMVLLIPDSLSFPGWSLALTPKEFVLMLTISCVFATLFIKATTIGLLMNQLKLNTLSRFEETNLREMVVYVYSSSLGKFKTAFEKGYVEERAYTMLVKEQKQKIELALKALKNEATKSDILRTVIKLHAIGIERKYVDELFANGEITEDVVKRIKSKLDYQMYAIERGIPEDEAYEYGRSLDVFESMAEHIKNFVLPHPSPRTVARNKYLYYRALSIISRKVKKELIRFDECFGDTFSLPHEIVRETVELYESYRSGSLKKMEALKAEFPEMLTLLDESLARRLLYKNETSILNNLRQRSMVTTKVSLALDSQIQDDNAHVNA